ncbi:MAG: hypothetical protein FWH46_05660 [Methanimicrococcus sp.]|nr:hypothetical protein [Methanimicrococcus sp.]
MTFECSRESKEIYQMMKDFKVVPYSEIAKRLDEATEETIRLVENMQKS